MLDHPKFLLFIALVAVTLTLIGGILDGQLAGPDQSKWDKIQSGTPITKITSLVSMCVWNYSWMTGSLEYVAWIPFRVIWIIFALLIGIAVARIIRELLPIP